MIETLADGVTLYLGDCREILPILGGIDVVVTDPPYGIGFKGSSTRHSFKTGIGYLSIEDTPENVSQIYVPIIELSRKIAKRVCVTPGISNARRYPAPDGEGVIWYPSGANLSAWGFQIFQPIYYYGKCPFLSSGLGGRPTGFQSTEAAEENGHPCPKPIGQMVWLINRTSMLGETVLDPFMGSGTTGVAAVKLGRKFIGIEIEPKYFDISCRRISEALRQPDMFIEQAGPKQLSLMDTT